MSGFPRTVNNQPGRAVPGDFYGANPRATVLGGEANYVAPADGVTVGNFAWALPEGLSSTYVEGADIGFIGRNMQAVISTFLGESTMVVLEGLPVTLYSQGTFWAQFAAGANAGERVYADPSTGAPVADSTQAAVASVTASAGFIGTGAMGASFTGEITSNVLTASSVTGYIAEGDTLSGVGITPGTLIGEQQTGTPGGAGTYAVTHGDVASVAMVASSNSLRISAVTQSLLDVGSRVTGTGVAASTDVTSITSGGGGVGVVVVDGDPQRVASTTISSVNDTLVVTAVASGVLGQGSLLSGTGVTAGTTIVAQLTGTTGGIGTYSLSVEQVFASTTVSELAIPTNYYVQSSCEPGELAKISSW